MRIAGISKLASSSQCHHGKLENMLAAYYDYDGKNHIFDTIEVVTVEEVLPLGYTSDDRAIKDIDYFMSYPCSSREELLAKMEEVTFALGEKMVMFNGTQDEIRQLLGHGAMDAQKYMDDMNTNY